jgi:hypothetical protein
MKRLLYIICLFASFSVHAQGYRLLTTIRDSVEIAKRIDTLKNSIANFPTGGGTLKSVTQNGYTTPVFTKFGDTALAKATQTMVGFGDSYMRGSGAVPSSLSFFNLLALYNNAIADMRGLTGTTMQHLTNGDSCMFDRIYLIPTYNGTQKLLIFEYGTNDVSHAVDGADTAGFRTAYLRVIDTAIARGWSANRMLLITPGYFNFNSSTDQVRRVNYVTCVKNVGAARGVPVADVWALEQQEGYSNILMPDSLHHNNRGHRIITRAALSAEKIVHGTEMSIHGKLYSNYIVVTANPNEINPSVLDLRDSTQTNFSEVRGNAFYNGIGFGVGSLLSLTTGNGNTAFGDSTLTYNTAGGSNSAFGYKALTANTNGVGNTAVGTNALNKDTANSNTAVGSNALALNVSGTDNTAVGTSSLANSTTSSNTAVGSKALQLLTTGSSETAVGFNALNKTTTGSQNTAVGSGALFNNTTGASNVSIGYSTLNANVSNSNNTAVGINALNNSTSDFNTGIGSTALTALTTGNQNSSVGSRSLEKVTTGSQNVALGYFAGFQTTTGAGNIYIGKDAGNNVSYATLSNKLVIGNNTTLPLLDGTMATTAASQSLTVNGALTTPQYKLSALNTAPTSATATGTTGEIRIAADFIYVCVATNTWVRTALTTW